MSRHAPRTIDDLDIAPVAGLPQHGPVRFSRDRIRRHDARTGRLRWRVLVPGRCHSLAVDTADRVLAVMEHPALRYSLVQIRPYRQLIELPRGQEIYSRFSPRTRYLHTKHLDSTEYLWRVPGRPGSSR